jgi:hypothetical protein
MNNQWSAAGGNNEWLNFSISKNDTKETAQYRVYQACGWDTLVRPVSNDPRDGERSTLRARLYHEELKSVAPAKDEDAPIELPGNAQDKLQITWSTSMASPQALSYSIQLINLHGQNVYYPQPFLLVAFVHKEWNITDANVIGQVTLPDSSIQAITFSDDGVAPDVLASDGEYSAIFSPSMNGIHTVNVQFDNNAGTAKYTALGFQPAVAPDGTPQGAPALVLVGENFLLSRSLQIAVSNAVADDYGNTPSLGRLMYADNQPLSGKIEAPGDVDTFKVISPSSGATVLRVTNLSFGMNPRMRILKSDGTTVMFDFTLAEKHSCNGYLFVALGVLPPGSTIYAQVMDTNPGASGGVYDFSVGAPVDTDQVCSADLNYLYIPMVRR